MTNKLKINKALAALMLVASVFAGWQTALIVAILLIIFTDVEEDTKTLMSRVIAFLLIITIINYGWDLILQLWAFLQSSINDLVGFINSYLSYSDQIELTKLDLYFFGAFGRFFNIADKALTIFLTAAKLFFVTGIVFNKNNKPNFITKKLEPFITKIINYVTNYGMAPQPEVSPVQAAPAPQPAPMPQPMPAPSPAQAPTAPTEPPQQQ